MENENVPKQPKISHNISKMLSCIENANKNIQSKCHVPKVICLRVASKTKIVFFSKTDFVYKFPFFFNFSFVFHSAFENYCDIFTFDPKSTNQIHFPIIKDTVEENKSIFTVLKGDVRHKNKKLNILETENVRSQFKTNQNILKILSCIKIFI